MSRITSETPTYLASLKLSDAPYIVWIHGDLCGKVAVFSPQPLTEKRSRLEVRGAVGPQDWRQEVGNPVSLPEPVPNKGMQLTAYSPSALLRLPAATDARR